MKDLYKNPLLYYMAIPVFLCIWPAVNFLVNIPKTEQSFSSEKENFIKAENVIGEILKVDPERLNYTKSKDNKSEFDYVVAVDNVARICGIPSSEYKFSAKPSRTTGGQKTQNATITVTTVDIAKLAQFISTMQVRWANLELEKIKLTKAKDQKDRWKADLEFKYYF